MPAAMTASVLCAPLVDGPPRLLHIVHRSAHAQHLADRSGRMHACLIDGAAIRLPHSLTLSDLPGDGVVIEVGKGTLRLAGSPYRVSRWWRPARPQWPGLRRSLCPVAGDRLLRVWRSDVGRGEGLTPYGDDVLCGALVTLRAAGGQQADGIARAIVEAPLERLTTAASAALLRLAAEGWCIDALARYLEALATGVGVVQAQTALRTVGGSSGRGLLEGVHMVYGAAAVAGSA